MKEYDFTVFANRKKRDREEIDRAKTLGGCEADILDVHLQEIVSETEKQRSDALRNNLMIFQQQLEEEGEKVMRAFRKLEEKEDDSSSNSPKKMPRTPRPGE